MSTVTPHSAFNAQKAPEGSTLLRRRASLIVQIAGASLSVLGLIWIAINALIGFSWLMFLLDIVLVLAGLTVLQLRRKDKVRLAGIVLYTVTFVLLCIFSVWLDIPSAVAPRSIHTYFLPLAISAYLVFYDDSAFLRHTVLVLCCVAFLFFDSSNFGIMTPSVVPEFIRVYGVWANNATAIVLMLVMISIMQADLRVRDGLEAEFRDAVAQGELVLHYQAQADVAGRFVGAEALMRWRHPVRGLIPPDVFIPMAERSGLIFPAGNWAIRTACLQLVQWQGHPLFEGLSVSVNVSAAQLRRDDFVANVLRIIEETAVPVTRLKLELTESTLIHDVDSVIAKMAALKSRGVGFSLDDFGTGYSSLSHLKRLPLDQLKIDIAFVRDVLTDPSAAAIAQTIIHLGQSLGLQVIAEGVETSGQQQFLMDSECKTFQGYLIGRPMPALEFEALVRAGHLASTEPKAG
jgi:EAL domain-containing protein (putative c-di-GMP-specific phosphodiesterase class I)